MKIVSWDGEEEFPEVVEIGPRGMIVLGPGNKHWFFGFNFVGNKEEVTVEEVEYPGIPWGEVKSCNHEWFAPGEYPNVLSKPQCKLCGRIDHD